MPRAGTVEGQQPQEDGNSAVGGYVDPRADAGVDVPEPESDLNGKPPGRRSPYFGTQYSLGTTSSAYHVHELPQRTRLELHLHADQNAPGRR